MDGSCAMDGWKKLLTKTFAAAVPKAYNLLSLEIGKVRYAGVALIYPEVAVSTVERESLGRRDVAGLWKGRETSEFQRDQTP